MRFADLGVTEATVLRAAEVPRRAGVAPIDAWDLDALRSRYDDLVDAAGDVVDRAGAGAVGPSEALVARTELMHRWRSLALTDPALPDQLLPDDWPRRPARARFVAAYDALGPAAESRVRELVGDDGADREGGPRYHRVGDIAEPG
jgi:phenylacetic acid degradation operon negative regulatory protein